MTRISTLAAALALAAYAVAADRPNIVVILADDFGVGDIRPTLPTTRSPRRISTGWCARGSA